MKRMFLLPIVMSILLSCSKEVNDQAMPREETVNKTLLLQLVNKVRKTGCQCGDTWYAPAAEVTWNIKLEKAAFDHASDMHANNFFSHDSQDGTGPGERISRAGYSWSTYGENIGRGYDSEEAVISGWLSSPGHCRNIMNPLFKEMGVGRVGNTWTQILAKP